MKNFFRLVVFFIFVYIILTSVIRMGDNFQPSFENCSDQFEVINDANDRLHQRDWRISNHASSFCTSYESREKVSLKLGKQRDQIIKSRGDYEFYWGNVYSSLVNESKDHIDFLVDSLEQVSIENELSRGELAELVVTFVQDIPYSYILAKSCESRDTKKHPCLGNIAFGLLSPYEFLHTLYGDCDTRAVLIYALLEELGFDPMIVISYEYAHAMLALNHPSTGDYLSHKGKKYYFWETTGKGWPLGVLPPSSNNVKYWKIALVNES